MRIASLLPLACLAITLTACGLDEGPPDVFVLPDRPLSLSIQEGDACLTYVDGLSAQRRVRTLKIRSEGTPPAPPPGADGEVVRLTVPAGLTVETPTQGWTVSPDGRVLEGEIKFGETLFVPLYFDAIAPGQPAQDLEVVLESFIGATPKLEDLITFRFESRPSTIAEAAFGLLSDARLGADEFVTHDVGKPRYESSWTQAKRVPEPVTDIVAHTTTTRTLDAQGLADLLATFPPGLGPSGLTVPARTPQAPVTGEWRFISLALDATIPLAEPDDEFQFVFASLLDSNTANDFKPSFAYPGDTFRGTDVQFALTWSALVGWDLKVTDSYTGMLREIASAAFAVVRDNALLYAIPPGQSLPSPPVYLSAFRHDGSFGQLMPFDWSMDYVPLRGDEPDAPIGVPPAGTGSPEAQAFDGSWRLDGAKDWCLTIVDGTVTTLLEDCTTPLAITQSVPGQTVTPSLVRWEIHLADGRRVVVTQNVDTSVSMDTALDVFASPADTLGVRTFPDLVLLP